MLLPALFDPRACLANARARTKPMALKLAAQALARRLRPLGSPATSAAAIEAALAEREALGSTGFGGGMAIPHARMAGLPAIVGAVITLEQPIPFESFDGAPVWLLVALAGPEGAGAAHLKTMARIARRLRADGPRLRGARDGKALFALMTGGAADGG